MNFKHGLVLSAAVLAVAGCGGSSDGNKSPRDPFIEFRVNGVLNPSVVEVSRFHFSGTNSSGNLNWDPCNSTLFGNAADVLSTYPEYCTQETSLTAVEFSLRYYNSTYSDVEVTYSGQGFTVLIYEYDEVSSTIIGTDPVWSSDYYTQMLIENANASGAGLDDFDPSEKSVIVGPSRSIPANAFAYRFEGNRNIDLGVTESTPFLPGNLNENPEGMCDWSPIKDTSENPPATYLRVICMTKNLLPLPSEDESAVEPEVKSYLARIKVNISGWTEHPSDVIIRVNPPE